MDSYTEAAVERAMKVQEVTLPAMAKTWWRRRGVVVEIAQGWWMAAKMGGHF